MRRFSKFSCLSAVGFIAFVGFVSAASGDMDRQTRSKRRPLRPAALSVSDRILSLPLVGDAQGMIGRGYPRLPRKKQLNPDDLMAILGNDFDPQWMSIEKPKGTSHLEPKPNSADAAAAADAAIPNNNKLWNELRKLNLTHNLRNNNNNSSSTDDSSSTATTTVELMSAEAIDIVGKWLVRRASCPIKFLWEDVGPLFWPPFIKRGECVNSPDKPCSWPPGMHCVAAQSTTIHLLRWHCRPLPDRRVGQSGGHRRRGAQAAAAHRGLRTRRRALGDIKCQWLKVPYPVTAECFCSC